MALEGALAIALVLIVAGVMLSKRINVPYTTLLVVIGIALSVLPWEATIDLTPRMILLVLLPPLLFEASFNLEISHFRHDIPTIALLTVPGVLGGALIIALLLHLTLSRPLSEMFVFGALIAATDPISVLSIFRTLGAPARLAALVESESLFNDGTAIVLFGIALTIVDEGSFSVAHTLIEFMRVAAGGFLLGLVVGALAVAVMRRIDDHLIEITITTLVAFGTNYVGERIEVSGVLAVVVAGLFLGHQRVMTMSPTTRIALDSFWEYIGFLGNAMIFLLIGERIDVGNLLRNLPELGVAILAVLISRALILSAVNGTMRIWRRDLPWRWVPVIWWGGVRGAVALALALALPLSVASHEWIETTTFGIVVFSLLVQGMTIKPLVVRLGVVSGERATEDPHAARAAAYHEALHDIQLQMYEGKLSRSASGPLLAEFRRLIDDEHSATRALGDGIGSELEGEISAGRRHALLAARRQVFELWRQDKLSEDSVVAVTSELNRAIEDLDAHSRPHRQPEDA